MDARLHGPRRPSWEYLLLNDLDIPIRALDGVTGGSVEVSATTRLGGSARLTLDDRGQGIDWMRHRLQIRYNPGIRGVDPWPVGTYLFTSPSMTRHDDRITYQVDLLSKLAILDEDTVEDRYSLAAATPIIPTVVSLIESTGETRVAVTESEATLSGALMWEAGTPRLTIINDLLQAAGYWALWVDGAGQYRVEPYTAPGDRATVWEFAAGETAIHEPGWSREQDLSTVPNRAVIVGQGTDDTPPLVGVATNENPESPYSYQARGRWITRTETGVEAADQAVIDQLAQRRLVDAMSPVAKLSVSHAIVPLSPNDVVDFQSGAHQARATVQQMTLDLNFDGQCRAEWREL